MVRSAEDNGLSPMPGLDKLNVRIARPDDASTIESFSAAKQKGVVLISTACIVEQSLWLRIQPRGFSLSQNREQAKSINFLDS
jgi:hypothetical protein